MRMQFTFDCPHCGQHIGSAQVHDDSACLRQQEINRRNLGLKCGRCGGKNEHKKGCPRRNDLAKWTVLLAVVACVAGCDNPESFTIEACGRACIASGKAMIKYSKTDGCICSTPASSAVAPPKE